MNEEHIKALTDEQLAVEIDQAMRLYDRLQAEQRQRIIDRLEAAYGHERKWVSDLFAGTRGARHGFEIMWCFYCGERPGWQREHKLPVSRGGGNDPSNIVQACMTCNMRKGTMTLEEYRASLERRSGGVYAFFGERSK